MILLVTPLPVNPNSNRTAILRFNSKLLVGLSVYIIMLRKTVQELQPCISLHNNVCRESFGMLSTPALTLWPPFHHRKFITFTLIFNKCLFEFSDALTHSTAPQAICLYNCFMRSPGRIFGIQLETHQLFQA